jgi:hypothetical protein
MWRNKDKLKIPPFHSAKEIVLTVAKSVTKHQYSSDLWPLKIKRNCIVDKSLAVRIDYCIIDKSLAVCPTIDCKIIVILQSMVPTLYLYYPYGAIRIQIPPFDSA